MEALVREHHLPDPIEITTMVRRMLATLRTFALASASRLAAAVGSESCHVIENDGEPLVVDWRAEQRGDLEIAMRDRVAVVAYDCIRSGSSRAARSKAATASWESRAKSRSFASRMRRRFMRTFRSRAARSSRSSAEI
jgi:hypothetical protein